MTDANLSWLDDSHIDPEWIQEKTGLPCLSCSAVDVSNQGRKGTTTKEGATLKLALVIQDQSKLSLIVKQVPTTGLLLSQQLGLAREALFYRDFNDELPTQILPKIYYSHGDTKSGAKVVIMEDLSDAAVDSGVFFGPGNPNNWNRNLDELAAKGGNVPAEQVTKVTFRTIAKIHAHFWKSGKLLTDNRTWLRAHAWIQGKERDSFEASQSIIRDIWRICDRDCIQWDPLLKTMAAKAVEGISWDAQCRRLNVDGQWTLVHGDFWPGNIMWVVEDRSVRLLDWEMCGIGSGPQDLGQYVLSNMEPSVRRANERRLVEAYFEELTKSGVDIDWKYCWDEYRIGGVERWLWFLVYFLGQPSMKGWAQFFHDQIAAFVHDHGLKESDITQARP